MKNLILLYASDCLLFAQRSAPAAKKSRASLDMQSVTMIIIGVALIAVLATVAYYVISNLRKNIKESDAPPDMSDHLTTFQEARVEGSMTAQEYDKVRAHLSKKIIRQVKEANAENAPADPDKPDNDMPKFIAK